ncbi:hypothetical protein SAMN06295974_3707 [Plantibacter flavus]|uniref:Uncharacterized protein n=1 Tax=Plantibacter flavus TaxID=150123 RepID=A0A3N2BLJ2_9MICO|nr:hypothetical protein [Plantibacter flavus]ROR76145.1 hypothetical protein EDD42_4098 [Plantibacter flavus]SMG48269.1 hypothetical protein SAMN06295974_3707 [Plantibacter flavus]
MSASNAGIKRNRLAAGVKASRPDIRLDPTTYEAFREAALASGNLSFSLYLERLADELRKQNGSLPIFTIDTSSTEVASTAAA